MQPASPKRNPRSLAGRGPQRDRHVKASYRAGWIAYRPSLALAKRIPLAREAEGAAVPMQFAPEAAWELVALPAGGDSRSRTVR